MTDQPLYEHLRDLRNKLANRNHVEPYMILTDRALRGLASIRPKSLAVILQPVGTVYILNADNNWTVTAENLPIRIKGELVQYSWAEQESVGYVAAGVLTSGDETIFTNRVTRVPETPDVPKKPTTPGEFAYFEEYKTALGIETIINHVGDCFD